MHVLRFGPKHTSIGVHCPYVLSLEVYNNWAKFGLSPDRYLSGDTVVLLQVLVSRPQDDLWRCYLGFCDNFLVPMMAF